LQDADERLRAGDLDGARAILTETLKGQPADQRARMFLFQLLCILGDWDRASTHLRLLASISPSAQMLAAHYGMAIVAERAREGAFRGEAAIPVLGPPCPWAEQLTAALGALARGEAADGSALRDAALAEAPLTPGAVDGAAFEWIADADGRFGPTLEVILFEQWGLLPFASLSEIRSEGPMDLRDLVWLPAQLVFRSGQSANALLPVRYPGTTATADAALQLARGVDWRDGPWGQEGVGQRVLALSDGSDVDLLSLRQLVLN
jgi:type VI secretion system protein ImpE